MFFFFPSSSLCCVPFRAHSPTHLLTYSLTARSQPYYDVLPSDFDNFPIFWNEEALGWLEGSSLVKQIEDRKRNMRSDYDHICKHIQVRACVIACVRACIRHKPIAVGWLVGWLVGGGSEGARMGWLVARLVYSRTYLLACWHSC